jgi:hypothetical protein
MAGRLGQGRATSLHGKASFFGSWLFLCLGFVAVIELAIPQ